MIDFIKRFEAMSKYHRNLSLTIKVLIAFAYGVGAMFAYAPANWFIIVTIFLAIAVMFALLFALIHNIIEISDSRKGWLPDEDRS